MRETIKDIINEKRTTAREIRSRTSHKYGRDLAIMLDAEADRLQAAYNHQRRNGSLCTMSCRESGELLNQYMEENKKLRSLVKELADALEVINAKIEFDPYIGGKWNSLHMCSLVDRAREVEDGK